MSGIPDWPLWAYFAVGFFATIFEAFKLAWLYCRRDPLAASDWAALTESTLTENRLTLICVFLFWPLAILVDAVELAVALGSLAFSKTHKPSRPESVFNDLDAEIKELINKRKAKNE